MDNEMGAWWAVALSESLGGDKPKPVVYEHEELVLFRNADGVAVALEDRCPHRRVPLSLGHVKAGALQCGYHGWTFDGSTGACTDIPNLHGEERVPARYAARAYPVAEANGFVHAWVGAGAPTGPLPTAGYQPSSREFTGTSTTPLAHDQYLAVMLDGPDQLLRFDGVRMTDFFLGDARSTSAGLVLDRGAVWTKQMLPANFVVDYPLIVRTTVPAVGGVVQVELLNGEEQPLVSLVIGSGANRRGTTSLCWRGFVHQGQLAGTPLRWRAARALNRPPFEMMPAVDGAAIAALLVAPSRDLAAARSASRPALMRAVG